jgi:hypothetical protein
LTTEARTRPQRAAAAAIDEGILADQSHRKGLKMRRATISAWIVLELTAANADTTPITQRADFLMNLCRLYMNPDQATDRNQLINAGYCAGILEGLYYVASLEPPDLRFCLPKDATIGQSVGVVIKYISDHPEQWNHPFEEVAISALHAAWPCQN